MRFCEVLVQIAGHNEIVVGVSVPQGKPVVRLLVQGGAERRSSCCRDVSPGTAKPWQDAGVDDERGAPSWDDSRRDCADWVARER